MYTYEYVYTRLYYLKMYGNYFIVKINVYNILKKIVDIY